MSSHPTNHVRKLINTYKQYYRTVKRNKKHLSVPEPYVYDTLDSNSKEIRVLEVAPGAGDDMVKCTLKHVSLLSDSRLAYETISYCWGPSKDPVVINLNGCLVPVSATSEAAVRRMRLIDQSRVLWIDAICINQSSLSERNEQVALMSDVYSIATQNLVYLGKDDAGIAEQALESVQLIVSEMRAATNDFELLYQALYDEATGGQHYSDEKLSPNVNFEALRSLLDLPWFR
jgi:hypothetical protein